MTATNIITLHNQLPYLTDEERTYQGYGATLDRPAPKFIRSLQAWERTAEKLHNQGKPYSTWEGKDFATATKIYKATVAKYKLNQPGPTKPFTA